MLKPILCAAAALAFTTTLASAQDVSLIPDSTIVGQSYGLPTGAPGSDPTPVGELDLVIEANAFFKNLELIDLGEIEGETFFGVIAPVRLKYQASEKVSFEFGLVAAQNFGDDDSIDDVEALIRLAYSPSDDVHLIAGTLIQTHWMDDALFDDVNKFRDLTEQGLQVRVDKAGWKNDSWINWRIREGEVDAEEFEIGNTSQLRLLNDAVRLDGQILWTHAGGQISTSRRVDDNIAAMVGASLGTKAPGGINLIDDLRLGVSAYYSADSTKDTDTINGDGWQITASTDLTPSDRTRVNIAASYFSGSDLLNRRGDPLYGFDEYIQLGANGIWRVGKNLRIELGGNVQAAGDETNWSALINFAWGTNFDIDWMRGR